jgi:hypothetical protein
MKELFLVKYDSGVICEKDENLSINLIPQPNLPQDCIIYLKGCGTKKFGQNFFWYYLIGYDSEKIDSLLNNGFKTCTPSEAAPFLVENAPGVSLLQTLLSTMQSLKRSLT